MTAHTSPSPRVHAFTDDALADHDAVSLAAALRSGELSRREVTEAAIARIRAVDPAVHGMELDCFATALADADTDLPSGPLAGVPSLIKDNADVAGMPTRHGSAAFDPHSRRASSAPARQFLAQGYTLLGKSTLPEFGLSATTEYSDPAREPTRNPWHTDHSSGASSGGSAALVAAGAVPIAHANDGGGSIRIPAAACGLVGLKPTRGRLLDRPGVRQLPVNLVAEGVVSRSVRDTAHHLAGCEAYAPAPELPRVGLVEGPSGRRLRIGVVTRDILGRPIDPEVERVVRSAADLYHGLGHEIVETHLDVDPRFIDDFQLYWGVSSALMTVSALAEKPRGFHPRRLDGFTIALNRLARRRAAAVPGAIRRLRGATAIYDRHFAGIDAMLGPTLAHPAPKIGELSPTLAFDALFDRLVDYVGFTPLNNVGGGPAISLPHGMYSGGLPGSVQLSAVRGDERLLLDLGYQLEAEAPFPKITDPA